MEVWILLAAAGSGYLARRWQNAQKPKGSSADEAEDDNGAGPSTYRASGRGRYRRFSSSGRRQVGKSICGKGHPTWVKQVPKNGGNINKVVGGDGGKKVCKEGHTCDYDDDCQVCVDAKEAIGDPNSIKRSIEEENLSNYLTHLQLSNSKELRAHSLDQDKVRLERNSMEEGAREGNLLSGPVSGKRASDSVDDQSFKTRHSHSDVYAGKRMKDVFENTQSGSLFDSWMPGFWDVSEGVFVLDTESLLVQHRGARSRGSSSSRKSRTPNKHVRGKGIRKKSLVGQKPMSSLESCLSAQLDEDYVKRTTPRHRGLVYFPEDRYLAKSTPSKGEYLANDGKLGPTKTEFAIGLPSLPRQTSSKKCSSSRSSSNSMATRDADNPFAGRVGSSVQGILFNFGVGVGMMFTVMSNMREARRLTLLLKEAESLIRDLEDELEAKEGVMSDPESFAKKSAWMDATSEQKNRFIKTLRKVKSATGSLSSMRASLSSGSPEVVQRMQSKDISKLEAELEAELERMELSLGEGDPQNSHGKCSASSELDGEVGSLVKGELTILGLPHEVEVESEDDDSSSSSHGDLHIRNYAVSPRALAKRLHEVLEARQEQQISELEAELVALRSKLKAREEEIARLKQRSLGVLPGVETSPVRDVEDKSTAFITLGGEALAAYQEACAEFSKVSGDLYQKTQGQDEFTKDPKHDGGLEQVDLLSLAQDFYGGGDPALLANMPAFSNASTRGRHYPRRKSRKGPHPEPEQLFSSSRGFDSSDDATNDTSGSTPCSVKFIDVRTIGSSEGRRKQEGKDEEGYKVSVSPYHDWSQEVVIRAGVNTPDQEDLRSIHPVLEDGSNRFMSTASKQGEDWAGVDDSEYFSELDEQLGHLLIKRIVEKSRKGSPIIQDARTVLASLEKSDRLQAADGHGESKC